MLAFLLLVFGVTMRLVTHTPNFTPIIALVLFGSVYLEKKYALTLPLFLMMATDCILGVHDLIFFTWGSLIAISLLGHQLRKRKNPLRIMGISFISALLFFIVSNFGVWLMGYYPMSFQGILQCYTLAIPFFRQTLMSTFLYSVAFFGFYELIAGWVKQTRLAPVLLEK